MTIGESFNNFCDIAKQTFADAINLDCGRNFVQMKDKQKMETILKVALIAAAAGIVCGLICGTGGIASGLISSVFVTGVVTIGMFAYFTNNENCNPAQAMINKAKSKLEVLETKIESGLNTINSTVSDLFK